MCSQSGVHTDLMLGWPLGGRERKSVVQPKSKLLPKLRSGPGPRAWQILNCHPVLLPLLAAMW